jgi:hypothetical protein
MNTTKHRAAELHPYLTSFVPQGNVNWVYNKTNGIVPDLAEIFLMNYFGYSPNPANELKANWAAFHNSHKDLPDVLL